MRFFYTTCLLLVGMLPVKAQQRLNTDSMFIAARDYGFRGSYDTARMEMDSLLMIAPEYLDARTFIGRTYNWQGDYAHAKQNIEMVLQVDPKNIDALDALIDAYRWGEDTLAAIEVCNRAIDYYPKDAHFKQKREDIRKLARELKLNRNRILADSFYMAGRTHAFNSQYVASRTLLDFSIRRDPTFYDAHILKARTFSWQGKYDNARSILMQVLPKDTFLPRRIDAYGAWTDLEIYDYQNRKALLICDTALQLKPNAVEFHKKKALAYGDEEEYELALEELQKYMDSIPNDTGALALKDKFEYLGHRNHVAAGWVHQVYSPLLGKPHGWAPWDFAYFQYGHKFKRVQALARVNYASRYLQQALQYEAEAYIQLTHTKVLFVNTGISSRNILYPRYRFGGEFYQAFLKKFDASIGYHYMFYDFDSVKQHINLFVGSLGYYYKDFWFSYRPVVVYRPYGKGSSTLTSMAQVRWYYKSQFDYLNFLFMYGNGTILLNSGSPGSVNPGLNLSVYTTIRYGVEWQKRLSKTLFGGLGTWYDYDEWTTDKHRHRFSFLVNVKKVF